MKLKLEKLDYKIKDISLYKWGEKEIDLARASFMKLFYLKKRMKN